MQVWLQPTCGPVVTAAWGQLYGLTESNVWRQTCLVEKGGQEALVRFTLSLRNRQGFPGVLAEQALRRGGSFVETVSDRTDGRWVALGDVGVCVLREGSLPGEHGPGHLVGALKASHGR